MSKQWCPAPERAHAEGWERWGSALAGGKGPGPTLENSGKAGRFPIWQWPRIHLRSQRRGKRGEWSVRVLGRWPGGEWNTRTKQLGWHRLIGVLDSVHDRTGRLHRYGLASAWNRRDVSGYSTSVSRRLRIPDFQNSRIQGYPPFRPQRSRPLPPAWDQPVASSFRAVGNREPGTPQLTTRAAHSPTHPPIASRAAQVASGQWSVVRWSDASHAARESRQRLARTMSPGHYSPANQALLIHTLW